MHVLIAYSWPWKWVFLFYRTWDGEPDKLERVSKALQGMADYKRRA